MDSSAFDGIGTALVMLFLTALIAVPFALWKLIELVIWVIQHISITVS